MILTYDRIYETDVDFRNTFRTEKMKFFKGCYFKCNTPMRIPEENFITFYFPYVSYILQNMQIENWENTYEEMGNIQFPNDAVTIIIMFKNFI